MNHKIYGHVCTPNCIHNQRTPTRSSKIPYGHRCNNTCIHNANPAYFQRSMPGGAEMVKQIEFLTRKVASLERMVNENTIQRNRMQRMPLPAPPGYGFPPQQHGYMTGGCPPKQFQSPIGYPQQYQHPYQHYMPSPYSYMQNARLYGGTTYYEDIRTLLVGCDAALEAIEAKFDEGKVDSLLAPDCNFFDLAFTPAAGYLGAVTCLAAMMDSGCGPTLTGLLDTTNKKKAFIEALVASGSAYNNIVYHNEQHAAGVINMCNIILKSFTPKAQNGGTAITVAQKIAMFIGALAHDVWHMGYSNVLAAMVGVDYGGGHTDLEYLHQSKFKETWNGIDNITDIVGANGIRDAAAKLIMGTNTATYYGYLGKNYGNIGGMDNILDVIIHSADVGMYARGLVAASLNEMARVIKELWCECTMIVAYIEDGVRRRGKGAAMDLTLQGNIDELEFPMTTTQDTAGVLYATNACVKYNGTADKGLSAGQLGFINFTLFSWNTLAGIIAAKYQVNATFTTCIANLNVAKDFYTAVSAQIANPAIDATDLLVSAVTRTNAYGTVLKNAGNITGAEFIAFKEACRLFI